MRPLARSPRPLPSTRRLIAAAAVATSLATGCDHDPPDTPLFPDETGRRLGLAASDVSQFLEDTLGAASIVTESGLTSSGAAAAQSIGWLMGDCVTPTAAATTTAAASKGVELKFADGGCAVPTTLLRFGGGLAGEADDKGVVTVRFQSLTSGARTLDGALTLVPVSPLAWKVQLRGLRVIDEDREHVLDADGSATITTDQINFTVNGAIVTAEHRYVYEAKKVARSFTECYPESGGITLVDSTDDEAASASLRFDEKQFGLVSSETGMVGLYYRDQSGPARLRARSCD